MIYLIRHTHTHTHTHLLISSFPSPQKRLQIATSIGLPVTLTELSIHTSNVTLRAWMLELMLRMAFSNPGVEAVVFWQFSDLNEIGFEVSSNITAFFNGPDFKVL